MKKLILTLGLVAGLTAFSFAQEVHSANDGHNHGAQDPANATPASLLILNLTKPFTITVTLSKVIMVHVNLNSLTTVKNH